MATKQIKLKIRSGSSFDLLQPETTIAAVTDLSSYISTYNAVIAGLSADAVTITNNHSVAVVNTSTEVLAVGPAFNTAGTRFFKEDGTWATPTDTNYYPTALTWTGGTTSGPTGYISMSTGGATVNFNAIPSASSSASGIVTTGTQTFAGAKTFTGNVTGSGNFHMFKTFTMIENADPQYILLCRNTGSNDVNGTVYVDRTSSNWQAAKLDIVVTSDSTNMRGGSIVSHQSLQTTEQYDLVTLTLTSNSLSYVAVRYRGNPYPMTTQAFFTGVLATTDATNSLVTKVASEVSGVTALSISSARLRHNNVDLAAGVLPEVIRLI